MVEFCSGGSMKFIQFYMVLVFPFLTFASVLNDSCKALENSRLEMKISSSNIANLNTTRTPDGGPYRKKELVCFGSICDVKEILTVVAKYEPDHPDADEHGYVLYPDINIMQEMESMIHATRIFEESSDDLGQDYCCTKAKLTTRESAQLAVSILGAKGIRETKYPGILPSDQAVQIEILENIKDGYMPMEKATAEGFLAVDFYYNGTMNETPSEENLKNFMCLNGQL